uniref:AAA+ ATPase domain-containing protein n=1 Tax=Taenioma perpusillum TaxID=210852 RepID=A0A1Z1MR17_9FLOR|nr:hypothetical protein [Taenioma perpusillum]ARW68530.1 hypothetical protein [Taenioma perpusillum]
MLIADDLNSLLKILPDFIKLPLDEHKNRKHLIEIVMDLGRKPEARFPGGPEYLSKKIITWNDLDFCIKRLGNFSTDNRSGIEYTLHRISSIKNRNGNIIGLTCRVGRAIFGTISLIHDLLEKGNSLLLLGKPGVGKTTAIREIARVLADEMRKRVVIIDTSNEIAGDGDIPHPAIGRARRMQVSRPELQHQVMIEAVENHMPEVIIIDEIGTEREALAARTIAERGVQLVGTAHGNYLQSLIKNPVLSDLVGGIQYVTLGDDEAKRRGSQKSILERKSLPAFNVAIEMHERNNWTIHENVYSTVDQILQGSILYIQKRRLCEDGSIYITCESSNATDFMVNNNSLNVILSSKKSKKVLNQFKDKDFSNNSFLLSSQLNIPKKYMDTEKKHLSFHLEQNIQLYSYGINIQLIQSIIKNLNFSIVLTRNILKADIVLSLKANVKHDSKIRSIARSKNLTIYTIPNSTMNNVIRALKQIVNVYKLLNLYWFQLYLYKISVQNNIIFLFSLAIKKIFILKQRLIEFSFQLNNIKKIQYKLIVL